MYRLEIKEKLKKYLGKLDSSISERIMQKLNEFRKDPYSTGKRRINTNYKRYLYRVGDYRIIAEIQKDIFRVINIDHRSKVYKK